MGANTLKTYISYDTNPYYNLAVEEYLLKGVQSGEYILYLWQNANTVVLGRNQNAYSECDTEKLLRDGGFIARRLSGGGCVYHDLGNLNFTFLSCEAEYDVSKQLAVIIKSLAPFGITAEKTGRNDISVRSRKFSGNAFYKHNGRCFHHGTILIDTDMSKMGKYLTVSVEKLNVKGVQSVRSRVFNLRGLNPKIDAEMLKKSLIETFGDVYGARPQPILQNDMDESEINTLRDKYTSNEWIYGRHMRADYTFGKQYEWGGIEFLLKIRADKVIDAQIFSDSMDSMIVEILVRHLKGVPFCKEAILNAVCEATNKIDMAIGRDIFNLFKDQEIWRDEIDAVYEEE